LAVYAEAAVEVAEVLAQRDIFERSQCPVADVLPPRHAALQRFSPGAHPAAEDHIADAQFDQPDRMRDDARVVLVVGVHHHHDVGTLLESVAVTGLLVAAVAFVLRVDDDRQAHLAGYLHGAILAAVVDQQDLVNAAFREVGQCGGQRTLRVVGGQHGHYLVQAFGRQRVLGFENAIDMEDFVDRIQRRLGQKRRHGRSHRVILAVQRYSLPDE